MATIPDHQKVRLFENIAHGNSYATVHELTCFLERNGFYPRREDIESILRRIDHDGNQRIGYNEYCELVKMLDDSETN